MRSLVIAGLLVGCANDPVYMACPDPAGGMPSADPMCLPSVEAGLDDGMGGLSEAKTRLQLPINLEKPEDAMVRAERTAALGVDVPYVKLGDIEVSVEWTVTNLTDQESTFRLELNGANEFFEYDPDLIVLSTDDEAPPTPALEGNIPLHVGPNGTYSGLFREDQVREASIDIEQVTRANVNPFNATLRINKNDNEIIPYLPIDPTVEDYVPMIDPNGIPIPREAFAMMIRIDLVFSPSSHMKLDYTVRVRDIRGEMMAEELMAAPADELTQFAPQMFSVMAAPPAP